MNLSNNGLSKTKKILFLHCSLHLETQKKTSPNRNTATKCLIKRKKATARPTVKQSGNYARRQYEYIEKVKIYIYLRQKYGLFY